MDRKCLALKKTGNCLELALLSWWEMGAELNFGNLHGCRGVHLGILLLTWTRGIWRMSTAEEMAELIFLRGLLDQVILTEREDEIRWKWTAAGSYSAKSAYQAQFAGSYCTFDNKSIWSAKVDDKHRFFAWLLIQCKLLTADKLSKCNCPCNPVCQLCDQELETAEHMILRCVFAQEV